MDKPNQLSLHQFAKADDMMHVNHMSLCSCHSLLHIK